MNNIQNNKPFEEYTILYVEDNKDVSEELAFFLSPRAGELYLAYDGAEGLELFKQNKPDVIITDIEMPNMNGLEMIERIRVIDTEVPIIITTAFNELDYLSKSINSQVDAYLTKPINLKDLVSKLHKVLKPVALKRELINKNARLETMNRELDDIVVEKTKELKYLYNHDPLTGLSNIISLRHDLNKHTYNYLLLLDLSNFSVINKQYGKEFANKILKAVSHLLTHHLDEHMKLYKVESDRFVILSQDIEIEKIESLCEQIIGFCDTRPVVIDGIEIFVNFSIGVTKITEDEFSILNAEYALEMGKDVGNRFYYIYNESADAIQKEKETIKWLNITKWMIQNDQIEPYYHPICDIQTKKAVKFEVLARGFYDGNVILPGSFIPSAERLGLIGSITRMMISKSFTFFEPMDYSFSINLSQRDLLDEYLIPFLQEKIEIHQLDPGRVTFEILENVTVGEHHTMILTQLQNIKKMGFKIAIDDFGVENSNFSRLIEIDFDYIKLDGLFVRQVEENEKDRKIIEAIVGLARALDIKTVAEYVETEAIFDCMKKCGVDLVQGYYISEPNNAEKTLESISKENR